MVEFCCHIVFLFVLHDKFWMFLSSYHMTNNSKGIINDKSINERKANISRNANNLIKCCLHGTGTHFAGKSNSKRFYLINVLLYINQLLAWMQNYTCGSRKKNNTILQYRTYLGNNLHTRAMIILTIIDKKNAYNVFLLSQIT